MQTTSAKEQQECAHAFLDNRTVLQGFSSLPPKFLYQKGASRAYARADFGKRNILVGECLFSLISRTFLPRAKNYENKNDLLEKYSFLMESQIHHRLKIGELISYYCMMFSQKETPISARTVCSRLTCGTRSCASFPDQRRTMSRRRKRMRSSTRRRRRRNLC